MTSADHDTAHVDSRRSGPQDFPAHRGTVGATIVIGLAAQVPALAVLAVLLADPMDGCDRGDSIAGAVAFTFIVGALSAFTTLVVIAKRRHHARITSGLAPGRSVHRGSWATDIGHGALSLIGFALVVALCTGLITYAGTLGSGCPA